MMKNIAAFLLACMSLPVSASVITSYDNRAAFNAAMSSITTIDFNGLAIGGSKNYGTSFNFGNVGVSEKNASISALAKGGSYGDPFTSDYLLVYGGSSQIRITFSRPVYGFAMDFGSILDWGTPGISPTETFNFAGSSQVFDLPGYMYHYTSHVGVGLSFIGYTSDTPFSFIDIDDPTRGLAFDNLSYTFAPALNPPAGPGTEPSSPIPEPASAALLGLGLLGVGLGRRKLR